MDLHAYGCVNLVQVGEDFRSEAMQREDVEMMNDLKLYNWDYSAESYELEMANIRTGEIKKFPVQEQQLQFHRGSEIPEQYNHQTGESFMTVHVQQPEPGRRIIGINLCVVYKTRGQWTSFPIHVALCLVNVSKYLYWKYTPLAYAKANEDEDMMMCFSHWKLAGHIAPGDGLAVGVGTPSYDVEVTRFGICVVYEDEAERPMSSSTWYQKLDANLSTYETSPGQFDLINQRHRCIMGTGHWFGGYLFFTAPEVKPLPRSTIAK